MRPYSLFHGPKQHFRFWTGQTKLASVGLETPVCHPLGIVSSSRSENRLPSHRHPRTPLCPLRSLRSPLEYGCACWSHAQDGCREVRSLTTRHECLGEAIAPVLSRRHRTKFVDGRPTKLAANCVERDAPPLQESPYASRAERAKRRPVKKCPLTDLCRACHLAFPAFKSVGHRCTCFAPPNIDVCFPSVDASAHTQNGPATSAGHATQIVSHS